MSGNYLTINNNKFETIITNFCVRTKCSEMYSVGQGPCLLGGGEGEKH